MKNLFQSCVVNRNLFRSATPKTFCTNEKLKPLHVSYAPEFYCPLPPGHTFPMKKYPDLYVSNILESCPTLLGYIDPRENYDDRQPISSLRNLLDGSFSSAFQRILRQI